MKKILHNACVMTILLLPIAGFSQSQTTITGTITFRNQPLPGATIAVQDKQQQAISNEVGTFQIGAEGSDTLVISYLGMQTLTVPINNRSTITADLKEDATALQEVTVNAGYYTVKEKERTGSIAKISAKDIEKQPVTNVLATMAGRMAGVEIIQDSGTPGGGFRIKIRGINSLRADGNEPLYIIDGVPFSSEPIGYGETSGFMPFTTSPLASIDPTDIESIEVLKDADATAIYGSRGANGVVLVTTKKGKVGKAAITAKASTAFGSVTKMLDLMDTPQYLKMRQEAFANDGYTQYPDYAYDVNGTWSDARYTDWQEQLIGGTAQFNDAQLSASGGSAATKYMLGGSYHTETSVMPGDFRYEKGGVHASLDHKAEGDRLGMHFSADYVAQKSTLPGVDLTAASRTLAPNAPALYNDDGSLNWENSTWANPLAGLSSQFLSRTGSLNASAMLTYDILPELQLRSGFGFTDLSTNESRTSPSTMYDPAYGLGSEYSYLNTNNTSRRSWIVEPQLGWSRSFGKAKIEALAGGTFLSQRTNKLYMFGYNFTSNSLITDMASAANTDVLLSDETMYKYQAFFARANYNYGGRYIINVTGRRDGSSRFGPGKQYANFGAVGAAWLFAGEKFLNDNRILSFGKLRASYGITGNDQIGDYQYFDTYAATGNNYQGVSGLAPSRLYNPAFGWESNKKLEVALELGFLKDRIFLSGSWYRNRSSDQLVGVPLPATTGFTSLTANLGATVQNSGIEFTLRTLNLQHNDFTWTTNLNVSANRNKLIEFPGLEGSSYAGRYVVGESVNIFRLYHFLGVDPETGLYDFEDANGDGQITFADDRSVVADLTPKFFGGMENQLSYKNFKLSFLFQFVKQKNFGYRPGPPGTAINQLADLGADALPFTTGDNGEIITAYYRYSDSDAAIVDASYIRLKNLALSYDVPLPSTAGIKFRLSVTGQNLLTFTKYNNGDPELAYVSYLPPLRVCSVGAQLIF